MTQEGHHGSFSIDSVSASITSLVNISRFVKSSLGAVGAMPAESAIPHLKKIAEDLEGLSPLIEEFSEVLLLFKSGNPFTQDQSNMLKEYEDKLNKVSMAVYSKLQNLSTDAQSLANLSGSLNCLLRPIQQGQPHFAHGGFPYSGHPGVNNPWPHFGDCLHRNMNGF